MRQISPGPSAQTQRTDAPNQRTPDVCSRPLRPEVAAALCVQAAFWATTAELVASTVSGRNDKANRRADLNLSGIRVTLAEQLRISEELVPLSNMQEFYKDHELHARLPLRYPEAVVIMNSMPRHVVEAYAKTFAATDLQKVSHRVSPATTTATAKQEQQQQEQPQRPQQQQ